MKRAKVQKAAVHVIEIERMRGVLRQRMLGRRLRFIRVRLSMMLS